MTEKFDIEKELNALSKKINKTIDLSVNVASASIDNRIDEALKGKPYRERSESELAVEDVILKERKIRIDRGKEVRTDITKEELAGLKTEKDAILFNSSEFIDTDTPAKGKYTGKINKEKHERLLNEVEGNSPVGRG